MRPGMPYHFKVEMHATAVVFKKGHRIRSTSRAAAVRVSTRMRIAAQR
jgi:hypothetical protein